MIQKKEINPNTFFQEKPYRRARGVYDLTVIQNSINREKGVEYTYPTIIVRKNPPKELAHDAPIPPSCLFNWFLKMNSDARDSIIEVIAQEIFRLFIPNQPKTRLVQRFEGCVTHLYIMSKEIQGFTPFKDIDKTILLNNLISQKYHGLGYILIIALLVNETDLSNNNIGVDSDGQVLKFDGGNCFATEDFPNRNYLITDSVLKALPKKTGYDAHNWPGHSDLWDQYDFSKDTHFQQEMFRALLSVILMPEEVLRKCIQDCIPNDLAKKTIRIHLAQNNTKLWFDIEDKISKLTSLLLNRQTKLKSAALKLPDFQHYLLSKEAEENLETYLGYLSTYTTISHNGLNIENYKDKFFDNLRNQRELIKDSPPLQQPSRI